MTAVSLTPIAKLKQATFNPASRIRGIGSLARSIEERL